MKFKLSEKISKTDALNMILDNMVYSDYDTMEFIKRCNIPITKDSLVSHLNYNLVKNQKKSLEQFIEEARIFTNPCILENILDSNPKFDIIGNVSVIKSIGEKKIEENFPTGSSTIAMNSVDAIFSDSYRNFKRAIKDFDVSDFISAVSRGISAIEYSIRSAADEFNILNSKQILIDDNKNKVSFIYKIDNWVPLITGQKVDKSNIIWESFVELKNFRDNFDQHLKGGYGINYHEICKLINIYKYGIAGMMFNLEKLFKRRISSLIIRAKYFPKVELIED